MPPQAWFGVSAVFHYLGPSFAVLLFPSIGVLGIAWLRIASAAVLFAPWTKPWRTFRQVDRETRVLLIGMGACLAAMNTSFYLALERLPMSLVATIEFVGTMAVALYGLRTKRNVFALLLTITGVVVLVDVRWSSDPLGLFWALLNGVLFVTYIVLGHRMSARGAGHGVQQLGAAMAVAAVFALPVGLGQALVAFGSIKLLLAGIAVGLCSSVVPYVCDQLAMSRLPRASFALLLALLPASATIVAAVVLAQIPDVCGMLGVFFVMTGIAVHQPPNRNQNARL